MNFSDALAVSIHMINIQIALTEIKLQLLLKKSAVGIDGHARLLPKKLCALQCTYSLGCQTLRQYPQWHAAFEGLF